VTYSVDIFPTIIVAGDFNGDNKLDLAFDNGVGKIGVMLGNGDGSFQPQIFTSVPTPLFLTTGDFNRDGKLDLAVICAPFQQPMMLDILLGNGDGTFTTSASYTAGTAPVWIAVADLNHDGKLDLVAPDFTGVAVNVLLGNGDGTFQTARAYPLANASAYLAAVDLDGDGNLDLVAAASPVNILQGNGDGTFRPVFTVSVSSGFQVATADLNGDSRPDLAVLRDNGIIELLNITRHP